MTTPDALHRALQTIDPGRAAGTLVSDEEWDDLLGRILSDEVPAAPPVRRPGLRPTAVATAVAAAVAFAVVVPALSDDPLAGAIAVERRGDFLYLRVEDATADPEAMTQDLRANGLDARVELIPASPSYVGRWIRVNGNAGIGGYDHRIDAVQDQVLEGAQPGAEVLEVPADLRSPLLLEVGRPAEDGERWAIAAAADAPDETKQGGLIHCLQLSSPPEIDDALRERGYHVEWRDAHADFSDPEQTGVLEGPPDDGVPVYSELHGDDFLVITVAEPGSDSATRPSLVARREAAAGGC